MKNLLIPIIAIFCGANLSAQNYISLGGDGSGDDHYMDAKEITYSINSGQDSVFIRIHTYNPRGNDFGYALAIDTNLNTQDGYMMAQNSLKNQTPNTSMSYDVALYAYQNGFFPTVYTESYDGNASPSNISFDFDTTDSHFATFKIPLNQIGGNYDFNIIAFTGSFDISPAGAGPGDAMPDASFSSLRTSELTSLKLKSSSFSVYPNPAKNEISIDENYGGSNFELLDMSGKKIMDIKAEGTTRISIAHLKNGVYFLRNSSKPSEVVKLFVEN